MWCGNCDITVDELLGSNKQQLVSQLDKAQSLIETALASGSVLAVDVQRMAKEQGISEKTLQCAKRDLNIQSDKRGNQWYWKLTVDDSISNDN